MTAKVTSRRRRVVLHGPIGQCAGPPDHEPHEYREPGGFIVACRGGRDEQCHWVLVSVAYDQPAIYRRLGVNDSGTRVFERKPWK